MGKEHPLTYEHSDKVIKPQYVIEKIYEITKGDAIICTEVGQNQMWSAQFYKYKNPRTFLSSGGLGTMGYGFPAALGAQIANPDSLVIDIAGDGSIQMNIQELATAVQHHLPVKIVILNNHFLVWSGNGRSFSFALNIRIHAFRSSLILKNWQRLMGRRVTLLTKSRR